MGVLAGTVAVVTGGAHSLGRTFCEALAVEGADIAIADIRDGRDTAAELARRFEVRARSWQVDVSDEAAVARFAAEVGQTLGPAGILVNNAALFAELPSLPFHDFPADLWDRVMAVNVKGAFLMAKHVAPMMIDRGRGKIINIGSGTAYKGMIEMAAYVTSKAAILGLTRCLARELGRHGVNVNTLAPGLIESPSVLEHPHNLAPSEAVIRSRALQRRGVPSDLLGALVFLASPASDFVTGQTLAVDGGSITL
ncbi:MAG: SDR family oxidoreductase [Burkholderiales bacterium]|nr:SDR family oxidoreductase [Burkholderiales bacterium]